MELTLISFGVESSPFTGVDDASVSIGSSEERTGATVRKKHACMPAEEGGECNSGGGGGGGGREEGREGRRIGGREEGREGRRRIGGGGGGRGGG